ncbi:MAG: HlyC/CorC family transporter [Clostridiales bacterium]|nr:HlyC/CorC family transporter [Clostridiales bacterium]
MESGDNPVAGCIIFLIFIILNSIFYGFGSAIQHINEGEVERKAEEGDKKSLILQKMLSQPHDLINTIQVLATLLSILIGFSMIHSASVFFSSLLKKTALAEQLEPSVLTVIVLIAVIFFSLILLLSLGILVPKKVCAYYAQESAYRLLPVVRAGIIILLPVSRLITGISGIAIRLFGLDPHHSPDDVTEDEIIDLVDEAHEQGVIQESEAEMIQNIMEFSDKSAKDIMTHRKNMNALEDTMTLEEAVHFMTEHSNSRYPVCHEDIDNIIGFIHIKDAMLHLMKQEHQSSTLVQIPQLIRGVAYIPETRSIDSIFKAMQTKKVHMAIVVDEYGQTAGLLTMEDILEEIVGNILDEYDESENFIQQQMDQSILMDGLTPLDDVEEVLGIDLGDCEFETLNGYLTSLLEHIPTEKDKEIHANGYCFQILSVENNIIQKLRVEKM